MNKKTKLLLMLAICSFNSWAISRDEILNKVISNLNQIKTVEYTLDFHQCFEAQGINWRDTATCYFDFLGSDSIIGSKYIFSSAKFNVAFNGGFIYMSDNANKQIIYSNKPTKYFVTAQPYLSNSIYIIRKALPKLVSDSTTTFTRSNDTILDNTACYKFKMLLKDKFINSDGILTNAKGLNTNLMLLISKDNYLPKQVTTFYLNPGYIQATFSNIKTPAFKADSLWNYDWLSEEYLRMSLEDFLKSTGTNVTQQVGKQATDWTLPMIKGDSIKLSSQKDNLILLDFWYQGCGACIKAVPDINEIQKEFKGKGLKVYGIEFVNRNTKGLPEYIDKNKIEYPTLYLGNKAASDYGVNAAPTFFLINKQGKIIYASAGLRKIDLLKAIKDNIK
jgi:thiol-disulfide isomerase/thioredoxin